MSRETISTPGAPAAIGPYAQAVRAGQFLFLSGQIPLDPATGQVVEGDVSVQTARVLDNLAAVLDAGGASFASVVRTTIFLADMNDFAAVRIPRYRRPKLPHCPHLAAVSAATGARRWTRC